MLQGPEELCRLRVWEGWRQTLMETGGDLLSVGKDGVKQGGGGGCLGLDG